MLPVREKIFLSRKWFRSTDLWVMGPARFHCATLLDDMDQIQVFIYAQKFWYSHPIENNTRFFCKFSFSCITHKLFQVQQRCLSLFYSISEFINTTHHFWTRLEKNCSCSSVPYFLFLSRQSAFSGNLPALETSTMVSNHNKQNIFSRRYSRL